MEECRKAFLHADGRAASTNIAGDCKEIFHSDHFHFLVAGHLGQSLEVYLSVTRNDAYDVPCPVSVEHKCLEYTGDILSETVRNMLCRQVILVKLVWNQPIFYPGLVQQSCCICLFYLLCQISDKISIKLSDVRLHGTYFDGIFAGL